MAAVRALLPLSLLLALGCGRTEPVHLTLLAEAQDGGLDGGRRDAGTRDAGVVERIDAGSRLCTPGLSLGADVCTRRVEMGVLLLSSSSCFVDVIPVPREVGTLTFDCDGGGAELRFDGGVFVGSAENGIVTLCAGTEFDYSDGCHWASAQRVEGAPSSTLRFGYEEHAVEGRSCASECSASALMQTR
jgi:hypothetical protein